MAPQHALPVPAIPATLLPEFVLVQSAVEQQAPAMVVRPMEAADGAFVFATWLNHMKQCSEYGKALPRDVFFRSMHRTVDALLKRRHCRVFVACPSGEPSIIVGYLVTDAFKAVPVIHFGFTKTPFRRMGVMRALVQASGLDLDECLWSCPTDTESWLKKKYPDFETLDLFR